MAVLKVIHSGNSPAADKFDTPKYHDATAISDVIRYCCQPSKIPHRCIGGFGLNLTYAAEQMEGVIRAYGKTEGVHLRHMVLSFEAGERVSLYFANQIAHQVAWYYGSAYQILYAIHEDTPHLHIHFVMNTTSYINGKKYAQKKEDYFRFLQYLAEILKEYGLNLNVAS